MSDAFNTPKSKNVKLRKKAALIIAAVVLTACVVIGAFYMINSDASLIKPNVEIVDADAELVAAVAQATLDMEKDSFYGECITEGNVIFGVNEIDTESTVYLMEIVSTYSFRNGFFMQSGGHSVPAVMRFSKTADGYVLKDVEYAKDGTYYVPSIKKMFPSQLVESVLNYPTDKMAAEASKARREAYAMAYLESIGRDAVVCDYGDIEHKLLTYEGVSVEVSNKLLEGKIPFDTEIGTYETVEDGIRYLFTTSYDAQSSKIIFTKEVYDTGELKQKMVVDSNTAEILSVYGLELTAVSPEFDATILEVYDGSILVAPEDYTDEAAVADKITVGINSKNNADDIQFKKGMHVTVVYDGMIAESYPAQITNAYLVYEILEPQVGENGLVPTTAQPVVVPE